MRNAGQVGKNGKTYCGLTWCHFIEYLDKCDYKKCQNRTDKKRLRRVYKQEIRKALTDDDYEVLG